MSGPVGRSRRVGPWMSSSLQRGPTSFRKRFAAGRLGFGDVVGILVAGTGACALALWGLDAVLVDHPVQATVRRPSAAAPILVAGDLGPTWATGCRRTALISSSPDPGPSGPTEAA